MKEKLENSLKKPVKLQNWNPESIIFTQSFSKNQNTEIIFDQNHLDFKTIIEAFETYKNKGFSFKIAPKNAGFLIGSNSSYDRGEIIKM